MTTPNRRPPRPWTDTDDATLTALHAAGKTLTAAATAMGRNKRNIHDHAKRLGLTWDRTKTAAATQARVLDAKARRAALQLALLEDAERLRQQLFAPCTAYNFGGRDNTYNEHPLEQPAFADQLRIMQAAGAAIDRSVRLAEVDSSEASEGTRSMLAALGTALGISPTS